ncbi:MAG: CapA family protein [Clostridia bacterium]|nr:CapA family protein [Clostridia bacterium]
MKILFAADMCFNRFENLPSKSLLHSYFNSVKPVFETTDFSMLNLECVLYDGDNTPIIKSGPALKAESGFVEALSFLNVDVAGLANNHTGDYRDEAIFDTINLLAKNNIASIGAGENITQAYLPYVFEKDGIKVAVLAICENEFGVADNDRAGVAGFNLVRTAKAIREAKESADRVVVFFHGGNENNPFPSPGKTELYRYIIDLGADAFIGMHTHCPQGYEIYNGKPIVYSMGNFYFPVKAEGARADLNNNWYFGYMTELDITKEQIKINVHPYHFGSLENPTMELLSGDRKESFMKYLNDISVPISDAEQIKHLFNIWCTTRGITYSAMLKYSHDMEKNGASLCCHMKNDFSCEAHNELVRNTLDMCYFDTIERYSALQDEINQYCVIKL